MRIHDISLPLYPGMVEYPGDPPFALELQNSLSGKDGFNLCSLALGSHCGTHLDAPFHYFPEGPTVDKIPLEDLMGPVKVIEVAGDVESILPKHLEGKSIGEGDRILFKTRNSKLLRKERFEPDFIFLSPEASEYLARKKVKLVGIDYLSIDGFSSENSPSHKILLAENIVILEGLDLANVPEGDDYVLLALPLKIIDCDGSPVRAVLIEF